MAGKTPQRTPTQQAIESDIGTPNFQNRRVFCMDGTTAQDIKTGAVGYAGVDLGTLCIAHIERSAQVQSNPTMRKTYVDQDILAPFRSIMQDKGYAGTNADALRAVAAYREHASNSDVRKTQGPHFIPQPGGHKRLVLVPGVAFDAAATDTYLAAQRGVKQPAPHATASQIREAAQYCFSNVGATIGQCWDAGVEMMRAQLQAQSRNKATQR